MRLSEEANAFRNDDFDGSKYFNSNASSILDSDLLRNCED
jgi:hypothetical protein